MKKHTISVPISIGELIDKITILEIKENRISEKSKLQNIRHELQVLKGVFERIENSESLTSMKNELSEVNKTLWSIEDNLREKEALQEFDKEFISLSRLVYVNNDRRYEIKNKINTLFGSKIVEEKSYSNYKQI